MSYLLAASSVQQKLGIAIGVVLLVGWLGYILTHLKKAGPPPGSEIELAPNRKPYYDDDSLETKKLDRSLATCLVLMAIVAVGLPAYWVREANRQVGAVHGFDHRSVHRGKSLFASTNDPSHGAHFGCADCHGVDGSGGVAKYTITDSLGRTRQVQWRAPAVNDVAYRYSFAEEPNLDPASDRTKLRSVLVYGRAGTPMPAWGTKGGGPMNDQQIDDVVAYLTTPKEDGGLMLSEEEAREQSRKAADNEAKRIGKAGVDGEVLFNVHCARCHTEGYSYGEPSEPGGGRFGPSLRGGATLRQFPDQADMEKFIAQGAEFGQLYGDGGIMGVEGGGMPHFGRILSPEDIRMIVEYERSLP